MPEENSFVRFHSGQNQFNAPFVIYPAFEANFQSLEEETELDPEAPYKKRINRHVPSGFCIYIVHVLTERLRISGVLRPESLTKLVIWVLNLNASLDSFQIQDLDITLCTEFAKIIKF